MTRLPLAGAADIAFPAGQKAFSTSLYCPQPPHTHSTHHPLQHRRAGQDGMFVFSDGFRRRERKGQKLKQIEQIIRGRSGKKSRQIAAEL